jgi:diguanylate cyclase (GGDEF)-like protein
LDSDKNELVCERILLPKGYEGIADTFESFRYAMNTNDINVRVFKERTPHIIDPESAKRYSRITTNTLFGWKAKSLATLPFMYQSDIIGTLTVFKQSGELSEEDTGIIETHIIPIFYPPTLRALQYDQIKRKESAISKVIEEQKHFLNFILDVNKLNDVDSIYHLFCQEILRRFEFDLAGILLLDGDILSARKHAILNEKYRKRLTAFEAFFDPEHTVYDANKQDGACLVAMDHNIHIYIPDCSTVNNLPMSVKDKEGLKILETARTLLIMPIRQDGKPIGVFWLWSLEKPVAMDDTALNIIDLLGSFVGTAINNAQLYDQVDRQKSEISLLNDSLKEKVVELHNLATTDKLTSLKNFAYFQEELHRRINEYRRCKDRDFMALCIFDVDHFKKFNDTYGHVAGNIALMDVASRIAKQARTMDIVCRYGGEEFVVILPKCNLEGAVLFAERVRESVMASPVKTDAQSVPVTISVGVAEYLPNEEQSAFIERANNALYRAKEGGRNCVRAADETPPE